MRLQAEPLGLERDRAAAGERVEDRRRVAARRLEDLRVRLGEQSLIARVLPDDEPLDDAVQPLALRALQPPRSGSGRDATTGRRRAGRTAPPAPRKRPARPPQVQRRRVAVADRLLPRRLAVDRLQRQRHLDELALRRAAASSFGRHQNGSLPCAQVAVPLAAMAGRVEVAGVEAPRTGSRGSGPRRAPGRAGRRARAPGGSAARFERRQHLVVGDEEVLGAGDAGLDLDPDRILAVALWTGRRSRGC